MRYAFIALAFAACSDDTKPADTSPETSPDIETIAETTPETIDETTPETSPEAETTPETIDETTPEIETTPDPTIVAVPGQRCALDELVGLITIEDSGGTFYLQGAIDDRPSPWYGAPELTTDACDFHRFDPAAACPPCSETELCGIDGTCSPAPFRHTDVVVKVTSTGDETYNADPTTGDIFATLTGSGPFAFDVQYGDVHITLVPTAAPTALVDLTGTLEGGYDAPTKLDVAWSTTDFGTDVFTRIPINHHAAGPTFTECTVAGSAGALSVGQAMLEPLAVITGLEFQGLEHTRFAAAQTPEGCVELRVMRREFVNLF